MSPKLSVCIPTYNRGKLLGEAIASIVSQDDGDVEIVISDNASSDDTEQVVSHWRGVFPRIVYEKNPRNLGADRNYLRSVELASGEYCWLMGSDDALAPHALSVIRPLLEHGDDVLVTNRTHVNFDLSRQLLHECNLNGPDGQVFNGGDDEDFARYLRQVRYFTAVFPYLSNLIVRRAAWNEQPVAEQFIGSAWIHVAQIFGMLKAGGRLRHVKDHVVFFRTENDSFLASVGHCRRALIDIGYLKVVRHYFSDRELTPRLMSKIVYRHSFSLAAVLSARRHSYHDEPGHASKLEKAYWDSFRQYLGFWPKFLLWRASPPWLMDSLYRYRTFAKRVLPHH